jgi:hypothetical protein
VGLGPVAEPPFLPAHAPNRRRRATSQLRQRAEVAQADAGVPVARNLPVASPGGASNTSCRCSRAHAAGLPKESLCAERTQCRPKQHGQASSGDLFATCDAGWEAAVRSLPIVHHQRVVGPLPTPSERRALFATGSAIRPARRAPPRKSRRPQPITYSATIFAPQSTLPQRFTHKNGFRSRRSYSDPLAL